MSHIGQDSVVSRTGNRRAWLGMVLGGLAVVTIGLVAMYYFGAEPASANPQFRLPGTRTAAAKTRPTATQSRGSTASPAARLDPVAVVNGRHITRAVLRHECLRRYGQQVLESLVNKFLISQECKNRGIVITRADVDAEITRMAQRFSIPKADWLKMLQKERGITPAQYATDLIWPILALRRLAKNELTVTPDEVLAEYKAKYGRAVEARMISCKTLAKAEQIRARAVTQPDQFAKLAKQFSEDAPSASAGGRIPPIREHSTYSQVEQAAFNMEDGAISPVISAGGQYVILQRTQLLPASKTVNYEEVAPKLEELVRDRKLRSVAKDVFRRLQDRAQVVNVMDDPIKSRAMPGVAATVNGGKVTIVQLGEACIERYGEDVLEGTINHTMIQRECDARKVTISEAEIDREITRAAADSLPLKDGRPDVEAWIKLVTEQQGVSVDVYRSDAVWPSIALKKLVGNRVKVTPEDIQKGYEANYAPRVRCRVIVMNNLRRAQHVWKMARDNPTVEYFGDLAAEYSIEPGSRALRGEVPPIKRHGGAGQEVLEKKAFALQPGELSDIVQLGDQYVILLCEGYTKPVGVDLAAVRDLIHEDIHAKKTRVEMAKYFHHLQDTATIDNYLAGTIHRPKKTAGPVRPPDLMR